MPHVRRWSPFNFEWIMPARGASIAMDRESVDGQARHMLDRDTFFGL
jgi:hypothetical protein